jgi:hypothetical protein
VALTGYDLDRQSFSPGDSIQLALYWRALGAAPSADSSVVMQLLDPLGRIAAEWEQPPLYPTSRWRAGDVWRDWHTLPISAALPAGIYDLRASLTGGESSARSPALLAQVEVQGRPHRFDLPSMEHAQPARLGDSIEFLGYDLSPTKAAPGGSLRLVLYWRALSETATSYTVFTHLLGAEGEVRGQSDGTPGGGSAPTTGWVSGEVLADEYRIEVDPDAQPGAYAIEIGMYDAATGQRLPVLGPEGHSLGDRLLLDTRVQVR